MFKQATKKILVTGGAGYVGSYVAKQLAEQTAFDITVLDSLTNGHFSTVEELQKIFYQARGTGKGFKYVKLNLADSAQLGRLFADKEFDSVLHFAADILVSESLKKPLKYYLNNTCNTIKLVSTCLEHGVKNFVFSSTAAVYGQPEKTPITEETFLNPINPYGFSKYMNVRVIVDAARANKSFNYVILRYFNVAGAERLQRIGELHQPETHLIPLIAKTALGKRETIIIFGTDYPTPDGTCIRDYLHVEDLSDAHLKALGYLDKNVSGIFNCGYGRGYSVQEVVKAMKEISGHDFQVEYAERREGDPPVLVASNKKITDQLGWQPKYDDLKYICKTALEWERKQP